MHIIRTNREGEMIEKDDGKSFWGTTGQYLPKYMLKAFVEEIPGWQLSFSGHPDWDNEMADYVSEGEDITVTGF